MPPIAKARSLTAPWTARVIVSPATQRLAHVDMSIGQLDASGVTLLRLFACHSALTPRLAIYTAICRFDLTVRTGPA